MRSTNHMFSIRAAMLSLVCGGVVVALLAASAAGWVSYREYRDRIGSDLIAASRAVMIAVDNELDEPLAFVNGLSVTFARGDFSTFQAHARDALSPYGYIVIIKAADGKHEYVNTAKSLASEATELTVTVPLHPVTVSINPRPRNGYLRQIEGQWMALIDIPLEDASGQNLYTMSIGVPNGNFQPILAEQHFPPSWRSVILDADWRVVARNTNLEKFIGQKGGAQEFRNAPTDRTHEVHLLEGIAAMAAHSRSSRYGWTTAIAISETDIFNQAIGPVLVAASGGFIAAAIIMTLAAVFLTYFATAIATLAQMVRGFPEGTLERRPTFRLREISLVARRIQDAALAVLKGQKAVETELRDTRRLIDLSVVLAGEGNRFESCLAEITRTAIAISGANKGTLQVFDASSNSLRIVAQQGYQQEFLKFFERVDDHVASACGVAIASNEQVIVSDVLTSDIFVGQPAQKVLLDSDVRAVMSTPLRSSKGSPLGVISTHFKAPGKPSERELRFMMILAQQAADYLERKESEQIQQTIVHELQHRSNNLLAVIQSIAHRSLHDDQPLAQGRAAFEARLQALARANRALLRSNWGGVGLAHLVRGELEAFSSRATITGVSVILSAQQAQNFALALHELATNCTKYGAFSKPGGKVEVSWTIEPNPNGSLLKFRWDESGGPPVSHPVRQGFGTQLLKNVFSDARLEYPVQGIKCEIDVHLVSAPKSSILEPSRAEISEHDVAYSEIDRDFPANIG